jgi:sialidase-1
MKKYYLLLLLFPFSGFTLKIDNNFSELPENFVFKAGEGGYFCFRTPTMVRSNQGTILAFSEGRVESSDDEGVSWTKSKNITPSVYLPYWGWSGLGPCHGIVKTLEPHKGRVIIPSRHEDNIDGKSFSHIIYSDDNGETWHIGGSALRRKTTESTVVELSDGSIMLNSRNGADGQQYRMVSISKDGGESFFSTDACFVLNEPTCQGSLLRHSFNSITKKANILFSNPNSSEKSVRVNGTIRLSDDDGSTWTKSFRYSQPSPAFSGYSDIMLMPDNSAVGVLFETGRHYRKDLRYDGIAFKIVYFNEIVDIIDDSLRLK